MNRYCPVCGLTLAGRDDARVHKTPRAGSIGYHGSHDPHVTERVLRAVEEDRLEWIAQQSRNQPRRTRRWKR